MYRTHLVTVIICGMCAAAQAQIDPDPALWNGGFTNPGGEQAVPAVIYDPSTGLLGVNTVGLNGVRETTTPFLVEGDDVGLVALSISSPEPVKFLETGRVNYPGDWSLTWVTQYFNGKAQLFFTNHTPVYMPPFKYRPMIQYEPYLACSVFGDVGLAVRFERGLPGATAYGSVQCGIVPEPSCSTLMFVVAVCVVLQSRSRTLEPLQGRHRCIALT